MSKTVVITGANRGIGLSLSKHFLQSGNRVYGVCRQSSAELRASGAKVVEGIDVSKPEAVEELVSELRNVNIDLLINNAGILRNEVLGQIDYGSIEQQFAVNALAPLRLTEALKEQLAEGSKVVMITSRMGSIADNSSGGRYGYRMSKAALNIAAVSLAHDLAAQGVAVAIIHPGLVGTEMIGGHGDITPDQAASRISERISELDLSSSGTFWHSSGDVLPW